MSSWAYQPLVPASAQQLAAGAYTLTAAAGSFSLTGQSTGLTAQRQITAASGSFSLTGQAVGLYRGYILAASNGSFSITGSAANLLRGALLSASAGSFAMSGNNANLLAGWVLTADNGSYSLTGIDVSFLKGSVITASHGSYALTGNDAGLTAQLLLTALPGSFALTGYDADLVYSPATSSYTLEAESASFTLSGNDAGLIYTAIAAESEAETADFLPWELEKYKELIQKRYVKPLPVKRRKKKGPIFREEVTGKKTAETRDFWEFSGKLAQDIQVDISALNNVNALIPEIQSLLAEYQLDIKAKQQQQMMHDLAKAVQLQKWRQIIQQEEEAIVLALFQADD